MSQHDHDHTFDLEFMRPRPPSSIPIDPTLTLHPLRLPSVTHIYPLNMNGKRPAPIVQSKAVSESKKLRRDDLPGLQSSTLEREEVKAKSTRGSRACTACRRSKTKCVGAEQGGPCKRCVTSNYECIFEESNRGKRSSKKHELLTRSLRKMERTLDTVLRSIGNPDIRSGMVSRSPSPAAQAASVSALIAHTPPPSRAPSYNQPPPGSPKLRSLPDNTLNPLGLLAEAVLVYGKARGTNASATPRTCNVCRLLKIECFRAGQDEPCKRCISDNLECLFEESSQGISSSSLNTAGCVNPSVDAARSVHTHDITAPTKSLISRVDPKIEEMTVMLRKVFSNRQEYKQLLSCHTLKAQVLLDMFQQLLDVLDTSDSKFRSDLIVASQRLAAKSGLYPMCFELKDIATVGEFSVSNGAFADIYKGTFQNRLVCLKTIRLDQKTDIKHFLKVNVFEEAILWGQLSHPNLLPFYGIYRFRNRISLVSPWMEHGDINDYLRRKPSANRGLLARDVAEGLRFLHNNEIIHGDLKGPNILVNELERACVADFGLSSISDPEILAWTSQSSFASKGGSVRWQAPELFDPESDEDVYNTVFSDVYAWACVAYEIFTGQVPFSHLSRDTAVSLKVTNGERPSRPADSSSSWSAWGLTEGIWTLMEDCWKTLSTSRPTVKHIIERLDSEMIEGHNDTSNAGKNTEWNGDALSPARFREMARIGLGLQEGSIQALQTLIDAQ